MNKCVLIRSIEDTIDFELVPIVEGDQSISELAKNVIPKREYTPVKGDKIFLVSGCNIPRFKVKQFCKNYEVSLVKYIEKANAKFIGPECIYPLVDYIKSNLYYQYSKKDTIAHIIKHTGSDPAYLPLLTCITNCESPYVVFTRNSVNPYNSTGDLRDFTYSLFFKEHSKVPSLIFRSMVDYEKYTSYTTEPEFYDQNQIITRINTGGIMGVEEYQSIQRLLKSSDKENVKLAMEGMANCDYEKSCVFLMLLLKEYRNMILTCHTYNHVNFQSMIKFFEIQNYSNTELDLNDIIESLLKRKLLNKANLDMLMPIAEDILKEAAGLNHFKIKEIEISDEVIAGISESVLNKNYDTVIMEEEDELTPN